ncbi:MAG TPA: tRNA uridine-5-carboxymethylaminomethyl(34) synthesis enzyme MnmG [Candidatus Limnocylindria bacterium]|nr:tRNA uridine-5-carboxymethylaminomethyl(34) synthesis enzyme MnmG [Candidatus Limnocylindria bacterium]
MSETGAFDLAVVGAGHAGCEAALAAARLGLRTLLVTLNLDSVALMPCNPSIGGTGKSQLVREVDALGGQMALNIDRCTLQSRTLNTGKGPAVQALRAQADKNGYRRHMRDVLFAQDNLTLRQGEVKDILTENGRVSGIRTVTGSVIHCLAVVVAAGVYLDSRVIIGDAQWDSGPQGLMRAAYLSDSLRGLGFALRRFKTGTPARIDARSIDFSAMAPQPGDEPPEAFSRLTMTPPKNLMPCYLTWTNAETNRVIRENLHRSPLFSGEIKGTGARYCPSIEDKVHKFADKDRHQVFLEPEGMDSPEWYAQGLSSSLPEDVQVRLYQTIPGLQDARLTRLAYAIEYDCIDPTELSPAMASNRIPGLYFAGQINGTSGYEEAAAQGILAGVNAALYLKGDSPLIITRDQAYMGVLADDLSSKGVDEPYRMMTGRAEFRLSLRQDNADLRLLDAARRVGLAGGERLRRAERKARESAEILALLREHGSLEALEARWQASGSRPAYDPDSIRQAKIQHKYEGYLDKEAAQIRAARAMEDRAMPEGADYAAIGARRIEARQKLSRQRPASLGQAARIPGVTPADVAVLSVWLKKQSAEQKGGRAS